MNKKEKDQLLSILKSGLKYCFANAINGEITEFDLSIEKKITKPENVKLVRKWITED